MIHPVLRNLFPAFLSLTLAILMFSQTALAKTEQHSSAAYFDIEGFINEAIARGVEEIALAKYAKERSQSQATRSYIQYIVNEHTDLNQSLINLADKKNVKINKTSELTSRAKQISDKEMEGQNFDLAYARRELKLLENTMSMYHQAAQSEDYDIKKFATHALVVLEKHRKMAEQLIASSDESIIPQTIP